MKRWPTKPLSEVATCLDSQRIPVKEDERQPGSVPYYGANGQVGWINKAIFNEPLLLVAEDGGHFDEPERGVAYTINGPSWVNNHAHALRADESKVLLDFLGYHFRHFDFQPYITGTTRAKLTQRDLMRVSVPVPPLAEQGRIVGLLDEADELRKLRAQADHRTTNLIPALFREMFGDCKFKSSCVGDLTSLVTSGSTPKGGDDVYTTEGPYFIRSQNVRMNRLDLTDAACLPDELHAQMMRTKVLAGDVLLNITGASIGRVTWVDKLDREANVSQHVCLIRPKSDFLNPTYLSVFISLPSTQRFILQIQAGASRQALNHQQVRTLEIPLPPLPLQNEFAQRVTEIRELEALQATSRTRLDALFQSMLHRAFNGEL